MNDQKCEVVTANKLGKLYLTQWVYGGFTQLANFQFTNIGSERNMEMQIIYLGIQTNLRTWNGRPMTW